MVVAEWWWLVVVERWWPLSLSDVVGLAGTENDICSLYFCRLRNGIVVQWARSLVRSLESWVQFSDLSFFF